MPTLRRSPITKLPQELVELIIAYFIHNTRALRACSLTCRSWYIAAVPHLHHTLTIDTSALRYRNKYLWPKPLQNSYYLGLLPIVKRLRIRAYFEFFTPKELNGYTLRFFSALTNLQELGIDHLQVSSFMPYIRWYFGHLATDPVFHRALPKPPRLQDLLQVPKGGTGVYT